MGEVTAGAGGGREVRRSGWGRSEGVTGEIKDKGGPRGKTDLHFIVYLIIVFEHFTICLDKFLL